MTDQRYLDDSGVRAFEATVERVVDARVVLDGTHFYPEGGGQPADHGTLEADGTTWDVVDVQKKDTIYHRLAGDADPPAAGTAVTGRLDWDRRSAHMRYHTAQHLLSALLLDEFDAETTGNQLYADRARIDCNHDRFDDDDLALLESRMNDLVEEARPVRWYVLDRDAAEETLDPERTRLSLLPDSITEIRIVEVGGADEGPDAPAGATDPSAASDDPFDRTACAGTHVTSTADVGPVELTGRETKGAEHERVSFVLGEDRGS